MMMDRSHFWSRVLIVVIICVCAVARSFGAQPYKVAILKSKNLPQFNTAVDGFKKEFQSKSIAHKVAEFDLTEGSKKVSMRIRDFAPDLIVPIGSTAARFAQEQFDQISIVFAMVLYPELSGIATPRSLTPHVTGASMDISLTHQFQTIQELFPRARRIGVFYNPDETGTVIEQARQATQTMDLQLVAIAVKTSKDLPSALEGIERKVDVLWSVADGTVFDAKTTQFIITYTLQHNLPFMGFSSAFVEAGALFALSEDFTDIGKQAAESAIRVLSGTSPKEVEITVPRKVFLVLNLRTADEIGAKIPPRVIEKAAKVIR